MKKVLLSLLLIVFLVVTACSADKAESSDPDTVTETVSEPTEAPVQTPSPSGDNKDALIYKYYSKFIEKKQFTFTQSMRYEIGEQIFDTRSSISRDGEDFVVTSIQQSGGQTMQYRTLFLDGKVYLIDDTLKTVQEGSNEIAGSPEDFADVLRQIEGLQLTSAQETVDGIHYATEQVTESGITTTYYFEGNILKFYEIGSASGKTRMTVEGYSLEADRANLEYPVDYEEIVESPIQ